MSSAFVPSPCSPITWIRPPPASIPGLITTRSPGSRPVTPSPSASTTPAPSAPRIRGFGTDGSPLRIQTSRWFSAEARRRTSTSPAPGHGIRRLLEHEHLGAAVLMDPHCAHRGRLSGVNAAELDALCAGTRARRDRRRAGRAVRRHRAPHPRPPRARPLRRHALHDGAARGVVPSRDALPGRPHRRSPRRSATGSPSPSARQDTAGCRATRGSTRYAELREKLDELGRRLGGVVSRPRRREPARRP